MRNSSLLVKGQRVDFLMFDMQEDSPLMRLFFSDLNSLNPLISMRAALWLERRSLDRVSVFIPVRCREHPVFYLCSTWLVQYYKLFDSVPLSAPSHRSPSRESQWMFWCFIPVRPHWAKWDVGRSLTSIFKEICWFSLRIFSRLRKSPECLSV